MWCSRMIELEVHHPILTWSRMVVDSSWFGPRRPYSIVDSASLAYVRFELCDLPPRKSVKEKYSILLMTDEPCGLATTGLRYTW